MIRRCYLFFSLAILFGLLGTMMLGCSSDSSGGGGSKPTKTPASIRVSAAPDSINPGQTTTITAVAYDASGNLVGGVDLVFTLDNPQVASINSSAKTGANGVATVTFTARDLAGTVIVTAAAGDVTSDPPVTISILSTTAPTRMNLTANPTAILVQGTASVKAELLDSAGNPVPDGTAVSFKSDNELYGTFTSGTATTNSGFASATFKAGAQAGTATVTVRSGNLSRQIGISILPALASAIEFVSAEPQRIAIRGSGSIETSVIKFVIRDSNNDPVEGTLVSFAMTGPNGDEYIDPPPDPTPAELEVSTNAEGIAQVVLHSGFVAGPVTIVGTTYVNNNAGNRIPISARSSVISIGGGTPSAKRFGISSKKWNIGGLHCQNVQTEISAYLADRFGNYNILKGTTVSFLSEAGLAIDTYDVTLAEDGIATVIARTQLPALFAGPEDVLAEPWENALRDYIRQNYGFSLSNNPRDGLCSVLAFVRGEELFNDTNANGVYDFGETFGDTEDDPFIDYNDNGLYDGPSSADPQEIYIDANPNNTWDGPNGAWDAGKIISTNLRILITGKPEVLWSNNSNRFVVQQGGSASLSLVVCDENGNPPAAGTKLTVATDNGKITSGWTTYTFPNSSEMGLSTIEFRYTISDSDSTDTDPAKATTVTATVTWEDPCGGSDSLAVGVPGSVD